MRASELKEKEIHDFLEKGKYGVPFVYDPGYAEMKYVMMKVDLGEGIEAVHGKGIWVPYDEETSNANVMRYCMSRATDLSMDEGFYYDHPAYEIYEVSKAPLDLSPEEKQSTSLYPKCVAISNGIAHRLTERLMKISFETDTDRIMNSIDDATWEESQKIIEAEKESGRILSSEERAMTYARSMTPDPETIIKDHSIVDILRFPGTCIGAEVTSIEYGDPESDPCGAYHLIFDEMCKKLVAEKTIADRAHELTSRDECPSLSDIAKQAAQDRGGHKDAEPIQKEHEPRNIESERGVR